MTAWLRSPPVWRGLALVPALAIVIGFLALPLGVIAVYSFLKADPYGGVEWSFTAASYVKFLFSETFAGDLVFDPGYLLIFGRSVLLATGAMVIAVLIGFPVAYCMALQPPHRQNLMVFLITIPFWTNLLIRVYCWILILRDGGVVNSVLMASGLTDAPITLLYTDFAILLGLVYMYIPFMILPIYSGLARLDLRLLEAAHDLYADRTATLREVVIPLALPGILAGCVLVFIPSLGNFIAPDLLGGGKNLTIGSLIQLQFSSARDWPFGAACALILMAAVMLTLTAIARGRIRHALAQGVA
jgi:spermidine/putrescine transport system permease protein